MVPSVPRSRSSDGWCAAPHLSGDPRIYVGITPLNLQGDRVGRQLDHARVVAVLPTQPGSDGAGLRDGPLVRHPPPRPWWVGQWFAIATASTAPRYT